MKIEYSNDIKKNTFQTPNIVEDSSIQELISCIKDKNVLIEIEEIVNSTPKTKNIVVVGIGGSSLGVQTIVSYEDYLNDSIDKNLIFLDNIDPISIKNKLPYTDNTFIVISKSGETLETITILKQILLKKPKNSHFIIITDTSKNSTLMNIGKSINAQIVSWYGAVSGRFSIFSIASLLPARFASCNIATFKESASQIVDSILNGTNKNPILGANLHYNLIKNDFFLNTIMPYSDGLQKFTEWYVQLWAESTGQTELSSMPIQAIGTIDQHSKLEMFLGGKNNNFINMINLFDSNEYISRAFEATSESLIMQNIPVRKFYLKPETALAEMVVHFIFETIYFCKLVNLNPFIQPHVDASKKILSKHIEKQ